jgi:SAM-dependent methyltransferase
MSSLWDSHLLPGRQQRRPHKITNYIPVYERHLDRYRNRPVTMLEIGCGYGGSLQMWKRYLGPHALVVGVDIEERCLEYEEPQVVVRIGDQSDESFLSSLLEEFSPIDIVLDDGSHKMDDIRKTFDLLYPAVDRNGVYIVEDLKFAYTRAYGGGLRNPGNFFFRVRELIDELHADSTHGQLEPTEFTRTTMGIHVYNGIVVFERGAPPVENRQKDY